MKTAIRLVLPLILTALGLLTQPLMGQSLLQIKGETVWVSADEVLDRDGSIKASYTPYSGNLPPGFVLVAGDPAYLGETVAIWQQEFWSKFGRASDLGLADGQPIGGREFCTRTLERMRTYRSRWTEAPESFEDWMTDSEAIFEAEVSQISYGFGMFGDPRTLVTLSVRQHLFPPERAFSNELHLVIPVGEFVAGETVFCSEKTWGGYRPNVGDRLVVGALFPPKGDARSILEVVHANQVALVVGETESLVRLEGRPGRSSGEPDGFPSSLFDLTEQINAKWLSGELDGPSRYDRMIQDRIERALEQ